MLHEPLRIAIEPLQIQTRSVAIGRVDPDGLELGTMQLSVGLD